MSSKNSIRQLVKCVKGTSMIFMVVMVTTVIFLGSVIMVAILAYHKLNVAYALSEDLYYKTDRVSQIVLKNMEDRVKEILKDLKVKNETNDSLDDALVQDIVNLYGATIRGADHPELNDVRIAEILNELAITEESLINKDMLAKAFYDIALKIEVYNDLKYNDPLTPPPAGFSSIFIADKVKDIVGTDIPDDTGTPKTFYKDNITIAYDKPQKIGDWLRDVCIDYNNGNLSFEDYFTTLQLTENKYYKLNYKIVTKNIKAGITKTLSTDFMVSSNGFQDSSFLKAEDAEALKNFNSNILSKALVTPRKLMVSGGGTVNIKGDVHAFGKVPNNYHDEDAVDFNSNDYEGIEIFGSNTHFDVEGNVDTRGYVKLKQADSLSTDATNVNFVVKGDVTCDTLFIDEKCKQSNININKIDTTNGGNLSTFDDIRVNGGESTTEKNEVHIENNYYGLNMGTKILNKSSSIIVNDNFSKVKIDGSAIVGGVAFISNVRLTRDSKEYAYKTYESVTSGENYKIYSYRIDLASLPADPLYIVNLASDYETWDVNNDDPADDTEINVLTKYDSFNRPNIGGDVAGDVAETLKRHFYYYLLKSQSDPVQYNYHVENRGLELRSEDSSGNKIKHYAPGIISAKVTDRFGNETIASFWGAGTKPWTGTPPSGFSDELEFYGDDWYLNTVNFMKTTTIKDKLEFIKLYNEDDINSQQTMEKELTDDGEVLGYTFPIIKLANSSPYCFYITNDATDNITIGKGSSTIKRTEINNKMGIIYTKGKVTIEFDNDITFNGTIIALGGIEIKAPSGKTLTINYDSNVQNELIGFINKFDSVEPDLKRNIRKFFSPGNIGKVVSTKDIYRDTEQNVLIVDNKILKN